MALNKILAIANPTQAEQPAIERALDTARITGAQVHVYCCVESEENTDQIQRLLDKISSASGGEGLQVDNEIEVSPDWRGSVVGVASRYGADMVFKHSITHTDVDREKRTTADWNLLRTAPCPVLMVKDFNQWQGRKILAAITPLSTDEGHQRLNAKIISFARRFADAYGSDAHFVTAFQDRNHEPSSAELAHLCGVSEDHVHIVENNAVDGITDCASQLNTDLIIIGTVARSGIKARVVGNTSERLLDHTESDILVLN